ncbi:unnamed protein product [Amoebophrya sp. A120]|nr:unnamed protein product [Amoebophrya sp. A120]|eukprot:GSA120T00005648001.1
MKIVDVTEANRFLVAFTEAAFQDERKRTEQRQKFRARGFCNRVIEYLGELEVAKNKDGTEERRVLCTRIRLGPEGKTKRLMREFGSHRFISMTMRASDWKSVQTFECLGNEYQRYMVSSKKKKKPPAAKKDGALKCEEEELIIAGDKNSLFKDGEWGLVTVHFFATRGPFARPDISLVDLYRSQMVDADILKLMSSGKLLKRMQLAKSDGILSDFQFTRDHFVNYNDRKVGDFSFSDGCSLMTWKLAQKVFAETPLFRQTGEVPAATQFRLPGVKGVVCVLSEVAMVGIKAGGGREEKTLVLLPHSQLGPGGRLPQHVHYEYDAVFHSQTDEKFFLSTSTQIKFQAAQDRSQWRFEILSDSLSMAKPIGDREVSHEVALCLGGLAARQGKSDAYRHVLERKKRWIFDRAAQDAIQTTLDANGPENAHEFFSQMEMEYKKFLWATGSQFFRKFVFRKTLKLLVVADFDAIMPRGHIIVKAGGRFLDGKCAMCRTPTNLPHDVQTFQAMNEAQIRYWWRESFVHKPSQLLDEYVMVSSKSGTTESTTAPVMDLLSGGDFDGDTVYVIFDPDIVDLIGNTSRERSVAVTRASECLDTMISRHTRKAAEEHVAESSITCAALDAAIVREGEEMFNSSKTIASMSANWYFCADLLGTDHEATVLFGVAYQFALDGKLPDALCAEVRRYVRGMNINGLGLCDLEENVMPQWRACHKFGYWKNKDKHRNPGSWMQQLCDDSVNEYPNAFFENEHFRETGDRLVQALPEHDAGAKKVRHLWDRLKNIEETCAEKSKKVYILKKETEAFSLNRDHPSVADAACPSVEMITNSTPNGNGHHHTGHFCTLNSEATIAPPSADAAPLRSDKIFRELVNQLGLYADAVKHEEGSQAADTFKELQKENAALRESLRQANQERMTEADKRKIGDLEQELQRAEEKTAESESLRLENRNLHSLLQEWRAPRRLSFFSRNGRMTVAKIADALNWTKGFSQSEESEVTSGIFRAINNAIQLRNEKEELLNFAEAFSNITDWKYVPFIGFGMTLFTSGEYWHQERLNFQFPAEEDDNALRICVFKALRRRESTGHKKPTMYYRHGIWYVNE